MGTHPMNIFAELEDIGRMLDSASLVVAVREEVAKVAKSKTVVTDGTHQQGGNGFQVVVRCGSDEAQIARRLRASIPNIETSHIALGVLGIRYARRVR